VCGAPHPGDGVGGTARKIETVYFHDRSHGPPRPTQIIVGEARVQVGKGIKYLGLWLDATWSFGEHFRRLGPRVEGVAMALSRLLPNLGGPGGRVHQVYTSVISSMVLYGAPDVMVTRRLKDLLRRFQRRVAARAYRTVSHAAATVLADMPPLELTAKMYSTIYKKVCGLRKSGGSASSPDTEA